MSSAAGPSAAPDDHVLIRREGGILVVTINRPQQRNAVNGAVSAGIARALDLLDSTTELRVGVLHGGAGLMEESPVERYFRDAREATIPEGTSQMQILHLGKALLGHSALR